jgi:hypothetical protein
VPLTDEVKNTPLRTKLQRIDFFGSLTLVATVATFLLAISLKTEEDLPWKHPSIIGLFVASAVCCVIFIWVEKFWASHPVLPPKLMSQRTPLAVGLANFFMA